MKTLVNKIPSSIYKIRFNDCDMFGHLNNSRYLDYFINAREDHLKEHYNFDVMDYYKNDLAWVISSHEIAYLRPSIYNEKVLIQSTLLEVEKDFLHVETIMMDELKTHLKSIMRSKLIPINTKTGRKSEHQIEFLDWAKELVNEQIDIQQSFQNRIKIVTEEIKLRQNIQN